MKRDIVILAKEGEDLTIEFKEKYSSRIAQDICAFANSMGGQILLGISDDGRITSEKLTAAMKAEIFSLGRNCDPPIEVEVEQVDQVVVVSISASDEKPHACGGAYYKRFDAVTQKLTRSGVKALFEKSGAGHFDQKIHPKATTLRICPSIKYGRLFVKPANAIQLQRRHCHSSSTACD